MKKLILWLTGAALLISLFSCTPPPTIQEQVQMSDIGPESSYSNWDFVDSAYVITEQFGFRAEYLFDDTLRLTVLNLHGAMQDLPTTDKLFKKSFNESFPVAKTWEHIQVTND